MRGGAEENRDERAVALASGASGRREGPPLHHDQLSRLLRAMMDQSADLMGVLDLEGRVVFANKTALELIGARLEAVEGRLFWETSWWSHDVALQHRLREGIRRAARGERDRFESLNPNAEGRIEVVDFSLTPSFDVAGGGSS